MVLPVKQMVLRVKHLTLLVKQLVLRVRRLPDTAVSVIWNSLPNDLKCDTNLNTFKSHVKTFLFAL